MEYSPRLATLLDHIEVEMKRLSLWEETPPSPTAFQSPHPFCFDTMSVPQWLQWVFIPRMREVLAVDIPLPAACQVAPALELYCQDTGTEAGELVSMLEEFDTLMPGPVIC